MFPLENESESYLTRSCDVPSGHVFATTYHILHGMYSQETIGSLTQPHHLNWSKVQLVCQMTPLAPS